MYPVCLVDEEETTESTAHAQKASGGLLAKPQFKPTPGKIVKLYRAVYIMPRMLIVIFHKLNS